MLVIRISLDARNRNGYKNKAIDTVSNRVVTTVGLDQTVTGRKREMGFRSLMRFFCHKWHESCNDTGFTVPIKAENFVLGEFLHIRHERRYTNILVSTKREWILVDKGHCDKVV